MEEVEDVRDVKIVGEGEDFWDVRVVGEVVDFDHEEVEDVDHE